MGTTPARVNFGNIAYKEENIHYEKFNFQLMYPTIQIHLSHASCDLPWGYGFKPNIQS